MIWHNTNMYANLAFIKKSVQSITNKTYSCVNHLDESDVAPRAEVAREIFFGR